MQRFAQHLSGKARVVLVDVDLWYDTALEQSGGGAPDLNRVYFENRSFSSSGSRWSLTQRRSATA